MGSTPPFLTRWASSLASSMMVRSAEKEVSKTALKPILRMAAVITPLTSVPGGRPNSSASDTEMDGACWTTTYLSLSARASMTGWMSSFSVRAPVGQTLMHWPQLMQEETLRLESKAQPMKESEPRLTKSMQATVCVSSQTRTHLPQRMHLSGSREMDGLEMSRGFFFLPAGKRRVLTP